MKFSEIISNYYAKREIKNFIKIVRNDCKFFLNNNKEHHRLYRGISKFTEQFLINIPVNGRKNIYSDINLTYELDKLMKNDGFKATRFNSIFTMPDSTNIHNLSHFGNIYIIYPKGEYDLTWFEPQYFGYDNDLGGDTWILKACQHFPNFAYNTKHHLINKYYDDIPAVFWNYYKKCFHHGTNVADACNSKSEIMIYTNQFHAIRLQPSHMSDDIEEQIYKNI